MAVDLQISANSTTRHSNVHDLGISELMMIASGVHTAVSTVGGLFSVTRWLLALLFVAAAVDMALLMLS